MAKKPMTIEELRAQKARLLWRLSYAQMQISAASETISLYLQSHFDEESPFHRPLCVAIVLRYTAPFISCETLGRLEGKWSKFPDAAMKSLHDNLIDGRNSFYAHIDPSRFKPMLIHIRRARELSSNHFEYTNTQEEKYLVSRNLPDIKALCDFQLARLMQSIKPLQTDVVTFQEAHEALLAEDADELIVHVPYPIKQP